MFQKGFSINKTRAYLPEKFMMCTIGFHKYKKTTTLNMQFWSRKTETEFSCGLLFYLIVQKVYILH